MLQEWLDDSQLQKNKQEIIHLPCLDPDTIGGIGQDSSIYSHIANIWPWLPLSQAPNTSQARPQFIDLNMPDDI